MNQLPPRVGGHYRIDHELVAEEDLRRWAATDTRTDTPVELVAPRAHVLLRPGAREEFEAVVFDHPACLPVLDRVEADGTPLRVRPLTQGTLAGVTLTPDEALAVARWLLPGVRAAGGAFGGELRPEDIAVDADGAPRLAAIRLPRPESLARVPFHRAPEILDGADPTAASDLFGLGVTLYRAVAGVEPYAADSAAQLRMRSLAAPRISSHTTVPPELDALLRALVSLDPAEREAAVAEPLDTPPTILLSRDHDAPFVARTALAQRSQSEPPPWVVLVPLAQRPRAELRRIAVRSGVAPEAVERAAERGAEWVLDQADSESEAVRLARRHGHRGLTARVQSMSAPGIIQYYLLAIVAFACWIFLPSPASWFALAVVALLLWRGWRGFRAGVQVAQARAALAERLRAPACSGAESRVWTVEHRLREADHLPAPLRADLREAVDRVGERLENLAVQDAALGTAQERELLEARRRIRVEREQLCADLTRLEVGLGRTTVDAAADAESPMIAELGRLARELGKAP